MSHDALIQQVHDFFDQSSNEPNIFAKDFKFKMTLQQAYLQEIDEDKSKIMMLDIINAIIYLKSNMYFPTQIRYDYVVCNHEGVWGLRHAICYRSIQTSQSKDAYNPKQYNYHKTQENQLMWTLGKIWLRVFVRHQLSPIQTNQIEINKLIDNSVPYEGICSLLKKMLTINSLKRISFQEFIEDEALIIQQHPISIKFMSSIANHFSKLHSILTQSRLYETLSKNDPFEQEIFKRNIKQSIDIANYLQGIKRFIKNTYKHDLELQFQMYIITAMAYSYLKYLDEMKINKGFIVLTAPQKKFYSKFAHRMISLEAQVQKKSKQPKFEKLTTEQKRFLIKPEQIKFSFFLPCYKDIFGIYYQTQQNIKTQNQIEKFKIDHQRRLTQFLLARSIFKIFTQARKTIFSDFVKATIDHFISITEVLQLVKTCEDPKILKKFRQRILNHFYE